MQLFRPYYNTEKILENLKAVFDSGWTGPGPQCKRFEDKWRDFTGTKYCHFVNSCTAALHLGVRLLDLPKGSPVLTTPLTFVSTNSAILYEGHTPVFVDINDNDLSLDGQDFMQKLGESKATAGIWVHYSGNASEHFELTMDILGAGQTPFQMIEDCAHAAGSFYSDGTRVGSRTDTISCFSYQAVKNLPTFDGGMICVPDEEKLARVKRLAWMGIDKDTFARTNSSESELYKWKYDVPELGWKYNGNDISATVALTQIESLDRENAYRKQVHYWYKDHFRECEDKVKMVHKCVDGSHHLTVIRVKNREEVIKALKANGIAPGVHYLPNYEFPLFEKYYKKGSCPNAERISKEIISIPNHLQVTKDDVDRISEVIVNAAKD